MRYLMCVIKTVKADGVKIQALVGRYDLSMLSSTSFLLSPHENHLVP